MDSEKLKLIKLKKKEAQDLSYWFKYLFWNKAEKEKILENISAPKESPFPPFLHSKNSVEYINKEHDSTAYKSIIVPPDKKNYQSYAEKYNDFMISQETVTPVYINNETTQIGSLKLHRNILKEMGNHYQLTEDELQNIESPYIAFDFDSWTQSRKIIKEEKVKIPDQIAHTIEEMKNTIPDFFTPRPSTLNIEYEWQVLPPEPSKEAKFANLYDEYNVLEKTFHNDAEKLKKILSSIIENKSRFASFFSGANRKASERLKQIENWQTGPLRNMPYNDVLDMFIAGGKWETFYNEVSSSKQDFETGLKEKEAQDKWEKEKKDKDDSLIRCKKELNDLSEEIRVKKERMNSDIEKKELAQNSLENDTDHSPEENLKKDDKKSKENEKIGKSLNEGTLKQCKKELKILREELKKYQYDSDKKIRNKEKEIESLENTLEQQYKNFSYKTAQNELSYLKKGKNGSHIKLSTYTLPEYALPEVGELYEDNQNYYLCIDYHEELKQANEIASGRYVKKPCKVVVKRTRI